MPPFNTATVPAANVQRDNYDRETRRVKKQAAGLAGSPELVFIGDSITRRFEREDGGFTVWKRFYARALEPFFRGYVDDLGEAKSPVLKSAETDKVASHACA